MLQRLCRIYIPFISMLVIFTGMEMTCRALTYKADILQQMDQAIGISSTITDVDSVYLLQYDKHDIVVRVKDCVVEHIGFRLFDDDIRQRYLDPKIADFVERYWLSLTLPLNRRMPVTSQMKQDGFVFDTGNVNSISRIQSDSALPFGCSVSDHDVFMAWGTSSDLVCSIIFPINQELILGRDMIENDRRLPDELTSFVPDTEAVPPFNPNTLVEADSIAGMWVAPGGVYYIPELTADRYYSHSLDDRLVPVFSASFPEESLVNLLGGLIPPSKQDISLDISQKIYGLKDQKIECSLSQFVNYCLSEGCTPYVGIVSIDDSGEAEMLVIMRNVTVGYNHLLRLKIPIDAISTGHGVAKARLNAFIPTTNIKNLFKY